MSSFCIHSPKESSPVDSRRRFPQRGNWPLHRVRHLAAGCVGDILTLTRGTERCCVTLESRGVPWNVMIEARQPQGTWAVRVDVQGWHFLTVASGLLILRAHEGPELGDCAMEGRRTGGSFLRQAFQHFVIACTRPNIPHSQHLKRNLQLAVIFNTDSREHLQLLSTLALHNPPRPPSHRFPVPPPIAHILGRPRARHRRTESRHLVPFRFRP